MKITSIDIGWENFAIAIESIKNTAIKEFTRKYDKLDKTDKIIERRAHTPILKEMLNELYKSSKNIYFCFNL